MLCYRQIDLLWDLRVHLSQDGQPLRKKLSELRGFRLGCWCKPKACHADVLVDLVKQL